MKRDHLSSWTRSQRFSPIETTVSLALHATSTRGTAGHSNSQCLWARSLKQRFWLEHCRIILRFTHCGNVFFFTSWFISAFSLGDINMLCKRSSCLLEAGRTFSLRWFPFYWRTCVENVRLLMNWVVYKSRLIVRNFSKLNLFTHCCLTSE